MTEKFLEKIEEEIEKIKELPAGDKRARLMVELERVRDKIIRLDIAFGSQEQQDTYLLEEEIFSFFNRKK